MLHIQMLMPKLSTKTPVNFNSATASQNNNRNLETPSTFETVIIKDSNMLQPQSLTQDVDDDADGYELQIALDQLAAGSTDALKLFLARKNGIDPTTASLRQGPWKVETDGTAKMTFAGRLDDTRAPYEKDGLMPDEPRETPRVHFEDTGRPFNYVHLEPELQQIRLLRLGPPGEQGIIRQLHLETFSLDDVPSYLCLSYVWGDPKRFIGVNCDGQMISVTQNLFHALQTCFNRHPDSWLWADGICVNQEDIVERSQQVLLMGSIYQKASMVLAHPGHYSYSRIEPDKADAGMTVLQDRLKGLGRQDMMNFGSESPVEEMVLSSPAKNHGLAGFTLKTVDDAYDPNNVQGAISIMTYLARIWRDQRRDKILSDLQWEQTNLPDPETESGRGVWDNLVRFWTTDWYVRTWVLQEVILGAKVVVLYGSTAISLDTIMEFWDLAKHHGLPRPLRIGAYADIFNMILHLSPVSSFKVLRDRREGLMSESSNAQRNGLATSRDWSSDENDLPNHSSEKANDESHSDAGLKSSSLLELLCLTRNNLATDARDKIYGLLGLTDDAVSRSIVPDYSSDNTPAKVFTDVATQMVESGLAADLLHHAGADQNVQGLPSWAPDWTMQSRSVLPVHLYNCLSGTTTKLSVLGRDGKPRLAVRGAVLARINIAGPAWRYYTHDRSVLPFNSFEKAPEIDIPPFNDEDARNFILAFLSTAAKGDLEQRYGAEGIDDALARTLAVDCSWQNKRIGKRDILAKEKTARESDSTVEATNEADEPASTSNDFFAGMDAFRRFYARGPKSESDLKEPGVRIHQTGIFKWLLDFDEETEADLQKLMVPFTVPFQEAQRGRRWAALGTKGPRSEEDLAEDNLRTKEPPSKKPYDTKALEDYFMGIMPWNAEIEDYVVLFEGFRTPFVLRKSQEDTKTGEGAVYKLIGDCYVHDAMDGQLMIWADEERDLGPDQLGVSNEGRKYAVRHPRGYAFFEDFIIV